jgi:hypothetical protein
VNLITHQYFWEMASPRQKPHSPFKFNPNWLMKEEYVKMVKEVWSSFNETARGTIALHLKGNL